MPTKHTDPMIAKLGDDEPIFIIRAQDVLAPGIVREWINRAKNTGVGEEKIKSAKRYLAHIRTWQQMHEDRVKLPD